MKKLKRLGPKYNDPNKCSHGDTEDDYCKLCGYGLEYLRERGLI